MRDFVWSLAHGERPSRARARVASIQKHRGRTEFLRTALRTPISRTHHAPATLALSAAHKYIVLNKHRASRLGGLSSLCSCTHAACARSHHRSRRPPSVTPNPRRRRHARTPHTHALQSSFHEWMAPWSYATPQTCERSTPPQKERPHSSASLTVIEPRWRTCGYTRREREICERQGS